MKDEAICAEECGVGYDHVVQDHDIDASKLAAPTPTMYSTECLNPDDTVHVAAPIVLASTAVCGKDLDIDTVHAAAPAVLASPVVCNEDLDIDTIHVAAPMPAICSTGDLAHGSGANGLMSMSMVR